MFGRILGGATIGALIANLFETNGRDMRNVLIALLLLGIVEIASAGPFEDGEAAYQRKDYAAALNLWRPLANSGNASAQYGLGLMYDQAQGVPQSYAEALKWYRLAAAQGNAFAQSNLGAMYVNGQGVPQSDAEALKWYRLAAAQGNAPAQNLL